MLEPASGGVATPRGLLHVGAWSVARHQLSLAVAMGCKRVICLGGDFNGETASLQRDAEAAGAQFHSISGARQLSPLVTSTDELLVVADGLMVPPRWAVELLSGVHCVVVQPAEIGLPAGFERVDLNHATAGLMLIPGRLVERLRELPADCDISSALTRIALQAGIIQCPVPATAHQGPGWKIIRSEEEAQGLENGWLVMQLAGEPGSTAGTWITRQAVRHLGPPLLHAGSGSNAVMAGAGAAWFLALLAGWFGFAATGFCLAGLGWLIGRCAGLLSRVERAALLRDPPYISRDGFTSFVTDVVLVALVLWTYPENLSDSWRHIAFPPLMLLGLLRILPRSLAVRHVEWLEDRLVLAAMLAIAAGAGLLLPVIQVLALVAVAAGILLPRIPRILTSS